MTLAAHSQWYPLLHVLQTEADRLRQGAIGGTIWHGVKGFRNSPRVPLLLCFSIFLG